MIDLLQTSGGSLPVVLGVLLGRVVAVALALAIAYRAYGGYRDSRSVPLLYLAVGILLVSAVPTLLGFAIPTLTNVATLYSTAVTNASKLLGLGVILYSIYGNP